MRVAVLIFVIEKIDATELAEEVFAGSCVAFSIIVNELAYMWSRIKSFSLLLVKGEDFVLDFITEKRLVHFQICGEFLRFCVAEESGINERVSA